MDQGTGATEATGATAPRSRLSAAPGRRDVLVVGRRRAARTPPHRRRRRGRRRRHHGAAQPGGARAHRHRRQGGHRHRGVPRPAHLALADGVRRGPALGDRADPGRAADPAPPRARGRAAGRGGPLPRRSAACSRCSRAATWDQVWASFVAHDSTTVYPAIRFIVVVAVVAVTAPHLARPPRRLGTWVALLGGVGALALAIDTLLGLVAGLVLGVTVAAVVHLVAGSPGGHVAARAAAGAGRASSTSSSPT